MSLKLYHSRGTRSLRPLWTLEEMGLAYETEILQFPPRVFHKDYLEVNPLGTVPYFKHGALTMTELVAICQYLAERCGPSELALDPSHEGYGDYLNWLYRSEATLTFPLAIVVRYTLLEPEERRSERAADDYTQWFFARLRSVEAALADREYLCAGRFTIADICVGFALVLADSLGLGAHFKPRTQAYLARLRARPAFQRANNL